MIACLMSKHNIRHKLNHICMKTNGKMYKTNSLSTIHHVIHVAVCHSLSLHCLWMFLDFSKLQLLRSARRHHGPFLWEGEEPAGRHGKVYFGFYIPPQSETLCFSSCLFKAPPFSNTQSTLIGQLTHTWASIANNNRAAVLNQFLYANLAAWQKLCKCVTLWCSMMSQSHGIKSDITDEAFHEQWYLWERGASVGVGFDL